VLHGRTIKILEGQRPRFSPDGRLTYVHGLPSHHSLVIDGKAGEEFSYLNEIEPPVFSRDGSTFAYQVVAYPKSLVVVGTKKGPAFEHIPYLQVSNDGKTVAYSVFDKGSAFVMVNDHKGPEYDWVGAPVISPDGTKVACRAWQGYREFIVVNDRKGETFNWVSDPVFSPDGIKLAYAASKGREIWWKVVNIP
jgi:Tol biopolymer transport system component